jgi:hypothetical protein
LLLLREYFELCEGGVCQDLLTEEERRKSREGTLYMSGLMQMANTKNGNGRIYSQEILEREIKVYKKIVRERRALGELDHPESSVVNLSNVSHLVVDIWMDSNKVMGKIEVLNTPAGNILKKLVESGVKLGISSRGLGSIKDEGGKTIVQDDFQLICFDMVADPSTPNAFMEKQLSEAKSHGRLFSKPDRINRLLNDIINKKRE